MALRPSSSSEWSAPPLAMIVGVIGLTPRKERMKSKRSPCVCRAESRSNSSAYFLLCKFTVFLWGFPPLAQCLPGTLEEVKDTQASVRQEGAATQLCVGNFGDITANL